MVKWIVPSMAAVVQEAVRRIRQLTTEARAVARWYERNPARLYLPPELEHLRKEQWISMDDMTKIVFAEPVADGSPTKWCNKLGLVRHRRGRQSYMRFADLESAVLSQLPPGFPVADRSTGLKYSDALFVIQQNALDTLRPRLACVIEPVRYNQIRNRLTANCRGRDSSMFTRCGFFEPDGSPHHLTTHQFRHYLNTLAQGGGLSQLDIALWSGRKDVRQNAHYDQETSGAVVERIRAAIGDDRRFFGPLGGKPRAALINRAEFARLKVPTAHTTDFGYCIHDYVMSPCQMHRDCLACDEQLCVKGEKEKEKRLRQPQNEAVRLLQMAEQADAQGEYGASEWVREHRSHLARINELLRLLDTPAVPQGAVVQLLPADRMSQLGYPGVAQPMLPTPLDAGPAPLFGDQT
jgi:hypothetical protein